MSEITPNTPNPVREDAYVEELAEKLGIDPQYIPKSPVWRNEEEIRAIAEMFANMSGGSGGGVLVVGVNGETGALDKTAGELLAAVTNGLVVVNEEIDGYIDRAIILDAHYNPDEVKHYSFGVYMGSYATYSAENSTDYPTMDV